MDTQETPLKDGLLYQQHVKFGKKSWRKVWAFLYADGPSGVARLESWDVRDGGGGPAGDKPTGRRGDRRVIRLADCVSVLPADGESCPRDTTAFLLTTTERSHVLAAQHRQTWMAHICHLAFPSMNGMSSGTGEFGPAELGLVPMEENSIYSSWQEMGEFSVLVQKTEAATRCQLKGPYLLVTGQDAIYLSEPTTPQPLYVWPYHFLRKFGHDKGVFSFEAGRRCDSGEGLFAFSCPRASEICRAVGAAIARQRELPGPAASRPCPLSRASSLPSLEPMGELQEAPLGLEAWGGQPSNGKAQAVSEAGPQSLPPCLGTLLPDGPPSACPSGSALYASVSKWSSGPLRTTAPDPASAPALAPIPVAEHLYENLCPLEDGCSTELRGEGLLQASQGGHKDYHIYDNSECLSWPGSQATMDSTLEAQYRRLLELDLNEEGEGTEETEDNGPGRLVGHSGFKAKLVTLLSRERKKGPAQRNQGLGPADGQA
ncbi:docking protein 3 [Phascolarctos cinereus]|uniref:Docking protein 3 n=1 Tax=Phascolarctos cinereus TaxID=38626 RepID=A0A6P5L930_PHACI|nr:docking protein 3 [Phascolarctos cinereus]